MPGTATEAMPAKKLRAGIIGGMGPDATVEFYQRVVNKTRTMAGAACDQDHILATIDMSPDIVNRQDAIIHGTDFDLCCEQMRQSGKRLVASGCDFAVCVCNSAHYFASSMEEGLGDVPLLSIVELTADQIMQHLDKNPVAADQPVPKVAILAASGCAHGGVYQKALEKRGIDYFVPDKHIQDTCMKAIYLVKSGDIPAGQKVFDEVLDNIVVDSGVNMVILGCTELPLLVPPAVAGESVPAAAAATTSQGADSESSDDEGDTACPAEPSDFGQWKRHRADVQFFDTVDILADAVVNVCKNFTPLNDVVHKLNNPTVFERR